MLNKEGILFISVMIFFTILLISQLIAIGYLVLDSKKAKKSINQ
jgi:hypothetical protein